MPRKLLALVLLSLFPSAAVGHVPPAPILTCQSYWSGSQGIHEYVLASEGYTFEARDGNISNCKKPDPVRFGIFEPYDDVCRVVWPSPGPPVCGSVTLLPNQPLLDYDGELDFGAGGAIFFVRSGDEFTVGVTACYGWPSVGHHPLGGPIEAIDTLGFGPAFLVGADYSRAGAEDSPDCGDNYVEPCRTNPPGPSNEPFPVNVVIDMIHAFLYELFRPGGGGCNTRDQTERIPGSITGPSGGMVPFDPGADGSYRVFVMPEEDAPTVPASGHVCDAVASCETFAVPPPACERWVRDPVPGQRYACGIPWGARCAVVTAVRVGAVPATEDAQVSGMAKCGTDTERWCGWSSSTCGRKSAGAAWPYEPACEGMVDRRVTSLVIACTWR